jgi:hypothetical protein
LSSSGASVWPTKTLTAEASDSAPEVPITRTMTQAKIRTMNWMTPT